MAANTQTERVTIVHIWNSANSTSAIHNPETIDLIEKNALFLSSHNVEYVIIDNSQASQLLGELPKMSSFQARKIKYIKDNSSDLKQVFLAATRIVDNPNIFFIFNTIKIDINSIYDIERTVPFLRKGDLKFFNLHVPANFQPKHFKLYMKQNKNIFEKIKLLFI